MYFVYHPDGQDDPTRWKYVPQKLMSSEREMLERHTDRNFSQFTQDVLQGNSLCRRALLFMFLKRDHPGKIKFDDVDFAWDEVRLEFSRAEYQQMMDDARERLSGEQLAAVLEKFEEEAADAYEDPDDSGKAFSPVAE